MQRTQNRYVSKYRQCLQFMETAICLGEEEYLRNLAKEETPDREDGALLPTVVEIYNNSSSWTFQRQILSLIVKEMDFQSTNEQLI